MRSLVDSVRLQLYERLSSPLFGTFVVSWACWNHRLVFVLFSNQPVDWKFHFIDTRLYPTFFETLNDGLIKPFLSAILFIYLYPIISKHFYGYWLAKQGELKQFRDKIEDATMLTVSESHEIRMELVRARDQYEGIIAQQAAEIATLKKELDAKKLLAPDVPQLTGPNTPDRSKLAEELNSLVQDGRSILGVAQNSASTLTGEYLVKVASWVTQTGELIRRYYGENSQRYVNYSATLKNQNFYNIHQNNHTHIAQILGILQSVLADFQRGRI